MPSKKDRNDDVEAGTKVKFIAWLEQLQNLQTLSVPRCVLPCDMKDIASLEIHHFSDTSEYGYGAVSYLHVVQLDGLIS